MAIKDLCFKQVHKYPKTLKTLVSYETILTLSES